MLGGDSVRRSERSLSWNWVQISGNGYSIFISNQLKYDIIIIITINNLVEKTKTHIFINKYHFLTNK
jgi:hypothetical protein